MSKQPVGSDLWYDPEVFSLTASGEREVVSLLLSQELWQADPDDFGTLRSLHTVEVDSAGTTLRLPLEAARYLYHALGAVLEED